MRQNGKKSAAKAPFATLMQLLQYDLRFSAAKHNSTPRTAAAERNLDAAIPLRSAKSKQNDAQRLQKWQLQNQISTPKQKKHDFEALFKRILLKENHLRQNGEKSAA